MLLLKPTTVAPALRLLSCSVARISVTLLSQDSGSEADAYCAAPASNPEPATLSAPPLRQRGGQSRKAIYSARETEIEMPYDPVQFSRVELSSRRGSLHLFSGRVSFQAALSDSRPCHSTSRCSKRPDGYAAFQIFSRRRSAELWRLMDDRRLGTFLRHSGNLPLHFVSDTGCRSPHRRCGYHRFHRSPYTARGHSDSWDRRS